MKKISKWRNLVDWNSLYYIASLIIVDFLGSIIFLVNYSFNWPALFLLPTAPLGSFELGLVTLSFFYKNIIFYVFAILFAIIKPIIVVCILKGLHKANFLAIFIYIIELFSSIYFVFSFRISQSDINIFFLFLECGVMIYNLLIVGFAIRNLKRAITIRENEN